MYQDKGDYDQALINYNDSLRIKKISLPKDHPSIATSYNNLGNLIAAAGNDLSINLIKVIGSGL